ncbi:right-handed parallel beta-helix repeat-containing protein [Microbacterium testaceum]|uniref:right-handed parallel beta-helix repeat-containing protein n=1 Tax=Microbacterium testaceum TaxID=2033 RepID=UPI003824D2C3
MDDDGALTAQERGDTHFAMRGIARVWMAVAVVVLVAAVVLTGNFVHTGSFLPWLVATAPSGSALVAPPSTPTAPEADASPQTPAERVAEEDARLSAVAALSSDDPALLEKWNTVVLAPQRGQAWAYLLGDLIARGAVRQDDAATFTLVRNVVVRPGAQLDLVAPGATLRLSSSPTATTSIVGWGGDLLFGGLKDDHFTVTSWDEALAAPDTEEADGRAYIRGRDAVLASSFADFADLGYWSGRTGGLAITGSGTVDAGVRLENSTMTGLHYGLFASESTGVGVFDCAIADSTLSGMELTNGGHDFVVQRTTVRGSGSDGISLSRQSKNLSLTETTVEGSAGWGIRIDGSALADGPTTGGYGLTPSSGFTVSESRVHGNRDGGIRVISTDDAEIRRTTVEEARTAILVEGPSAGLTVANADLSSSELRALDVAGTITDATVSDSRLVGRRIALELAGAAVTVRANDVAVTSGYAIELADGARADITGNIFRGTGQDAVAVWAGARTMQADNDQTAWRFEWAWVGWMNEHPMMWMWALVLLLPAVGLPLLWRRRREHLKLRQLLREALVRHGQEQVAAYTSSATLPSNGDAVVAPGHMAGIPSPPPASGPSTRIAGSGSWSPRGRPVSGLATTPPGTGEAPRAATSPRSFADLRTGALEGRTFASLKDFAVAAVVDGGYSVGTISRLFRIQSWRLQKWVDEAATPPRVREVSA